MLLFVVSTTALTSCKKDNAKLVGKWECVTASYIDDNITQPTDYLIGMVWEFYQNGNITTTDTFDPTDSDGTATSATYVYTGNRLTIKYTELDGDLETETYRITELTQSNLVIEKNDNDIDDHLQLTFKKI